MEEDIRNQYETETGKKWFTVPFTHGEQAFASWGYQLWLEKKISQVEPEVKPACFDWQKERPNKPCVVMTRVWNKNLEIYDYNIWRFEKIDCDGGWYLGWLTEDGEEWDDINDCHFDEYCIIESKSV